MSEQGSPHWYRLDNAGVLYAATQGDDYAAVYRFSAVMDRPVDPAALQRAVDKTMPRFPTFSVRMRRGLFWDYLEPNEKPGPFVKTDVANPCQPVRRREDNGWLLRVYYYEQRISVEVFHVLSDGAGTVVFFRTLLAAYLGEQGVFVPPGPGLLDLNEPPHPEEAEDAYFRYGSGKRARSGWHPAAYPNTGTPEPFYTLNFTIGFIPLDKLRQVAKGYNATVTEYLAAVIIQSIVEQQRRTQCDRLCPVVLTVPVNLRNIFPSGTLRNFFVTIRPGIDPGLGEHTLQEIVEQVRHTMKLEIQRHRLGGAIASAVGFQRNKALRMVPRPVKKRVLNLAYRLTGMRPSSAHFTNPGPFLVPPEMEPHIIRMECMLGQAATPRPHCTAISYGNTLSMAFTGTQRETGTEREFFCHLVREGIPVKVESNRTRREEGA